MEQELLDRVRRIETRVTRIGLAVGADVGGNKPVFDPANRRIDLPTSSASIAECMEVVPDGVTGPIPLFVKGELIGHVTPNL